MSDVIFARPRHEYGSYSDLFRLIELSGYPLIYIDEMDIHDSSKTYIYSTPDAELSFEGATARIVYWLIEWYDGIVKRPGISEIWTINQWFAEREGHKFVPIGSHPGLCLNVPEQPKQYDVALLSYVIPRRARIIQGLQDCGVTIAPDAWGIERTINLLQSRCMVHIHQLETHPCIAPLRACIAAAHSLPIVAELSNDDAPYFFNVWSVSYESIPNFTVNMLKHPWLLAERGNQFHDFLCVENTFRKYIEANV